MDTYTHDTFFNGRLTVKQHRSGYRYSVDAVILAHHVSPRPGEQVLDLGTGCGIIPLMLAFQYPEAGFVGVEIQPELAQIAGQNVRENGMAGRVRILQQDLKTLAPSQFQAPVDLVLSNPPFRRASSGRINPNSQRAVARHEIKTTLADVAAAAGRLLKTGGRFAVIYSAERLADLLLVLRDADIAPKYLRCIHSKPDGEAKLVLLTGKKRGNPGLKIGPPLVIYDEDGAYTEEVGAMFEGGR